MDSEVNRIKCIKLLEPLNVCPRCILRFLGEKNYISYLSKEQVHKILNKAEISNNLECTDNNIALEKNNIEKENDPNPKRHLPSLCCVCIGLLQDTCDTMASKVNEAVKNSGYEFSTFTLQLSIPVIIDLRQCLMFMHIKDCLGDSYNITEDAILTVKEVWKRVVGFHFGELVCAEFDPNGDFQIIVNITHPDLVSECSVLYDTVPESFPKRKKKKVNYKDIFTRTAVINAMNLLLGKLKRLYNLPPISPDKPCIYGNITCTHSPLYLGGRYNKYSRELSQTPWIIDGERKMESSVQELIINYVEQFIISDKIVFSSSGREDVDVKMLGNGRPFVLEIINPRCSVWKCEQIRNIESNINSSTDRISVSDLQIISKNDLHLLKQGEEQKRKTYSALCIVKKELHDQDIIKLQTLCNTKLKQATPLRVLHRRPLAIREKTIHKIEGEIIDPHKLRITVETQAGTYVKEFVHGDFGRTLPNLGMLLDTEADIVELDVMSIHLDWPPKIKD